MKRFAVLLAFVATVGVIGAAITASPKAEAADIFQAKLQSLDGGPSQTYTLKTSTSYALQCESPACVRVYTTSDGGPANCNDDPVTDGFLFTMNGAAPTTVPPMYTFGTTSGNQVITIRAFVDAGNPKCDVYLRTNPPTIH
jgi:hypothetical protein